MMCHYSKSYAPFKSKTLHHLAGICNTIAEIDSFNLPHKESIVKNLFLRDDKKRNYYLLVVAKDKTVNLKSVKETIQSRPLSFASENDLLKYLQLPKGSVTPLGILNNEEHNVQVYLDEDIMHDSLVGIHPKNNTATIFMKPVDLQSIILDHGNPCTILHL